MNDRLRWIAPPAVLALGLAGALILLRSGPDVAGTPPEPPVPLVRVVEVMLGDLRHAVTTHGTVAPRTESDLVPEVSGPAVWVSQTLVSGGFFEAGDELLRVDARDYEVAERRARATVARAASEHTRAKKDLERLRGLYDRDVASVAQLDAGLNVEAVSAAVLREARAALEQSVRDLERTRIVAPYDGRVRSEHVDVGQFVNRGAPIARIYAVDFAEVRLPIADEELAFLDLPLFHREEIDLAAQPAVQLRARFAGSEHVWEGRVVRTEGEIDPRSRMVHVVARVEDPYGRAENGGGPPLAVGLFVEAEIRGKDVTGVAVLPRAALRSAGRVFVVDAESRLRFRDVEVVRSTRDEVVIGSGLSAGELVCVSPLETVVDGMLVRVVSEEPAGVETVGLEEARS